MKRVNIRAEAKERVNQLSESVDLLQAMIGVHLLSIEGRGPEADRISRAQELAAQISDELIDFKLSLLDIHPTDRAKYLSVNPYIERH